MTEQEKFIRCFASYLLTETARIAVNSSGKALRLMVDFQYHLSADGKPTLNILQSMITDRDIEYIFGEDSALID